MEGHTPNSLRLNATQEQVSDLGISKSFSERNQYLVLIIIPIIN
jgi:hypothetical protein